MHHVVGLDLLDFFRGQHSWRKLHTLIRQLPSNSLSLEAMANDDELAASMPDAPSSDSGPRVSEYTLQVSRLDQLIDRVGDLISVTLQAAGGKAPRIRPPKRPETAFTRLEHKRRDQRMNDLFAEVEAAQERWAAARNN